MNDEQERALRAGLRALADTTRHAGASPRVQEAVLAAMAERHSRRRPAGQRQVSGASWVGYAAAVALLLASASGGWLAYHADRAGSGPIHPAGFLEIPGASALPPMESGAIVRVQVAISELPQYGVAIVPDVATEWIDVELLVGQDGLARAVRLTGGTQARSTP